MPTPLKGISGLPITATGGWCRGDAGGARGVASRDLRSTIEVTWTDRAREGTLTFGVTGGHFSLDEWIAPWGRGRRPPHRLEHGPPPDVPFDPTLKPFFSIRGTFKTASGQYRGVQCRNVDGALSIDNYQRAAEHAALQPVAGVALRRPADLSGTLYSGGWTRCSRRATSSCGRCRGAHEQTETAGIFSGNRDRPA